MGERFPARRRRDPRGLAAPRIKPARTGPLLPPRAMLAGAWPASWPSRFAGCRTSSSVMTASNGGSRLPVRGIHPEQLRLFAVGQRKDARHVGAEHGGPAVRGAPAHQLRGVAVVAETDGVAELVNDDVARDVGKVQRRPRGTLDADHALAGSVKRAR